jgi:cyanuric acid amidohydrolase
MPRLALHRLPMAHPADLSALEALLEAGTLRAAEVRAVIGKTEGNGGLNDFTRGYFTQSLMLLLARFAGEAPAALAARVPCVLSGGTEGVLSPHYTVFAVLPGEGARGLAMGTAFSAPTPAWQVGRRAQIEAVAGAVRAAMAAAGIASAADVALVQVKAPAVQPAALRPSDPAPRSAAAGPAMAYSRAAAALGVALALGEVPADADLEAALLSDFALYSNRASISSGIEVVCNEVVVFGQAAGWAPGVRLAVQPLADALDLPAVCAAFQAAGLAATPQLSPVDQVRLRCVLVKGEPDRRGAIRGARHTMLGDTDLDAQRHLRGALGGLVAGVAGTGQLFVSGGAEHQGPEGGGLIAVFAE